MAEITITYETLFDLLRRERNREELQSLEPSFFTDVLDYMRQKQSVLDSFGDQNQMFASAEAEKARIQFHNIKKIIKELYDRREKKIALLALNAVRTGAPPISGEGFLEEEKLLYDELHLLFSKYRREVLNSVLQQAAPFGRSIPRPSVTANSQSTVPSATPAAQETTPETTSSSAAAEPDNAVISTASEEQALPQAADAQVSASSGVKIRFLKAVPRFAGEDEVFGPYTSGDEAELPSKIAHVLLKKGRAEQI